MSAARGLVNLGNQNPYQMQLSDQTTILFAKIPG